VSRVISSDFIVMRSLIPFPEKGDHFFPYPAGPDAGGRGYPENPSWNLAACPGGNIVTNEAFLPINIK
jgi:hypothetical protein